MSSRSSITLGSKSTETVLPTRYLKRVNRVEVHLGMEDVLLDDLLLGTREDRHHIPGILPSLGQFGGLAVLPAIKAERKSRPRRAAPRSWPPGRGIGMP